MLRVRSRHDHHAALMAYFHITSMLHKCPLNVLNLWKRQNGYYQFRDAIGVLLCLCRRLKLVSWCISPAQRAPCEQMCDQVFAQSEQQICRCLERAKDLTPLTPHHSTRSVCLEMDGPQGHRTKRQRILPFLVAAVGVVKIIIKFTIITILGAMRLFVVQYVTRTEVLIKNGLCKIMFWGIL